MIALKDIPCQYYNTSVCYDGDQCPLKHDPEARDAHTINVAHHEAENSLGVTSDNVEQVGGFQ